MRGVNVSEKSSRASSLQNTKSLPPRDRKRGLTKGCEQVARCKLYQ